MNPEQIPTFPQDIGITRLSSLQSSKNIFALASSRFDNLTFCFIILKYSFLILFSLTPYSTRLMNKKRTKLNRSFC